MNPQGAKHRRILSPLRLPVPPSRRFVELFYSKAVSLLIHIGAQGNKCEIVQQTVKAFDDFHSSSSLPLKRFTGDSRVQSPLPSHNNHNNEEHPFEILALRLYSFQLPSLP